MLRIGSRGPAVTHRQRQLKRLGYYPGRIDGVFGPGTRNAVIRFQAAHNLSPDGVIGPATAAMLDRATGRRDGVVLRLGSRGPLVRLAQERLQMLGYYPGAIDGIFGPSTQAAVRAFQSAMGLSPDGVIGQRTATALLRT